MIKNILIFIVLIIFVGGGVWFFVKKSKSIENANLSPTPSLSTAVSPNPALSASASPEIPVDRISGQELKTGTGAEAKSGDTVTVNYVGMFPDGKKFDSSYDRGQPFTFKLGAGQVIKGWDIGVAGMKEGGKRKLYIPPQFGYGDKDYGPIPANSFLVFEVELLKVAKSQ